jgi:hypothetical protein
MTKSPQPPNGAEYALSTAEVQQLYLKQEGKTTISYLPYYVRDCRQREEQQ